MELAVLAMFGVGAWWGVVLGDSDDETEMMQVTPSGRRREVVDVTVARRAQAYDAMVDIPKPGYLIVKADIVEGSNATDDVLEMTPVIYFSNRPF